MGEIARYFSSRRGPFLTPADPGKKDGTLPAELPANAKLPLGQTSFSTDHESIEMAAQRSLVENDGGMFIAPRTCGCCEGGGRPADTEDPEC